MSRVVKKTSTRIISPSMTVESRPIGDLVQDRVLPRQVSTGIMRGTQLVGTTGAMIDAANNRIVLTNDDGSTVGIGSIPGSTTNEFGFFATDEDGTLVMKIVNGTLYTYNVDSGDNVVQVGKLTNGEYGAAFAKDGEDLVDGLGT